MMIPGTTAPQPGPRKPPPPPGLTGLPTSGAGPRLNIFCAWASVDRAAITAIRAGEGGSLHAHAAASNDVRGPASLDRGDEAHDLVFLQFLHDAAARTAPAW